MDAPRITRIKQNAGRFGIGLLIRVIRAIRGFQILELPE